MRSLCLMVLVGCANGEVPAQLEAIEVSGDAVSGSARPSVTGADRDWTFADEDGDGVVTVHTPSGADLGTLDGRALVFAYEGAEEIPDGATVTLTDPDPVWLAYRNGSTTVVDAWFGAGFADLGAEVAHERLPEQNVRRRTYRTAVFRTDDGPVELLPGDVDTLVLDGVSWRVGVVAAWDDQAQPTNAKCGGGDARMLSYELLRIDAPIAPVTVDRALDREIPQLPESCG